MKVLVFGAGPLGSLYAHLLHQAGRDVSLLARGARFDWLQENGVVAVNEITGEASHSPVPIIEQLSPEASFDLVIVLIRKNRLLPVFEVLSACPGIDNILFMGNNAAGFDGYLRHLPVEKLLFGFPGAGGGLREQVLHYADRESAGAKPRPVTIGELDGQATDRIRAVGELFESARVPVDVAPDIDGWLKYHVALIAPVVGALYKYDCDSQRVAGDRALLKSVVRAAKEGARVLDRLGYRASQPAQIKLMRWSPVFLSTIGLQQLFASRFAEVAFAMHAAGARDEMRDIVKEFNALAAEAGVPTPALDALTAYTLGAGGAIR